MIEDPGCLGLTALLNNLAPFAFLPPTIAQTAYTFSFDGYYGNMQMVYTNAYGVDVQFDCPFDEESFYARDCSYADS